MKIHFITAELHLSEEDHSWRTDIYDADGELLFTETMSERFLLVGADSEDRLFFVEETDENLTVVRYLLNLGE